MSNANRTLEVNPYRQALARKGWTVERAAAETGYSHSYLAMMIREPRLMSERMAEKLAAVLDLPPEAKP
jgi:lambda repressor-like predicted transcriptional regulator